MDRLFDPERVLLPSAVQSLSGISEDEELPNPSSNLTLTLSLTKS